MTLNEQKASSKSSIEWTRVYGRRGYTWNPIAGCPHQCRWTMPSGETAICYAESVAHGMAQSSYENGFGSHYWHPKRLNSPRSQKDGAGIFVGSMSDVFAHSVPAEHIQAVLDVIAGTPQHIYFMLTKNAVRTKQFDIPANVWLGASMPPDFMWGKPLARKQQVAMFHRTLQSLADVKATVKWISAEPLSWNIAPIIAEYPTVLQWAVIGAASHGSTYYAPDVTDFLMLQWELQEQNVPIFYKGNMRILPQARDNWLEQFPVASEPVTEPVQLRMFP